MPEWHELPHHPVKVATRVLAILALLLVGQAAEAALVRSSALALTVSGTTFGTGTYTTGSFSTTSASLLVCIATASDQVSDTLRGSDLTISDSAGLTWTSRLVSTDPSPGDGWGYGFRVWTAPVVTGSSITVSLDAGSHNIHAYIVRCLTYTGYDVSSPIGATFVSAEGGFHDATTGTLSGAPAATSEVLGILALNGGAQGGKDATPGATFTEDSEGGVLLYSIWMQIERRTGSTSTTVDWVDADSLTDDSGGAVFGGIEIKAAPAVPVITGASVSSQTETGYTVAYTSGDSSGTTYLVACKKDTATPTAAEVVAGTCTGGSAALATANETSNGADSISLGGSITLPIADIYLVHRIGTTNSSVASILDEMLDAPAGYQYRLLTSVAADTWCDRLNAVISPDIASADVVKVPTATSPGGYLWTQEATCEGEYTDGPARQSITMDIYDTSAGAWMSGGPHTLFFNNVAPVCAPASASTAMKIGLAMSSIELSSYCTDAEGDALTYAVTAGTLPAGLSLTGTGNSVLGGTPTTENEAGAVVTVTATDVAGDTSAVVFTLYPLDTVTVPDCSSLGGTGCSLAITAKWLTPTSGIRCYGAAAGTVIGLTPAAGSEVQPFTNVTMDLSYGPCRRRRN